MKAFIFFTALLCSTSGFAQCLPLARMQQLLDSDVRTDDAYLAAHGFVPVADTPLKLIWAAPDGTSLVVTKDQLGIVTVAYGPHTRSCLALLLTEVSHLKSDSQLKTAGGLYRYYSDGSTYCIVRKNQGQSTFHLINKARYQQALDDCKAGYSPAGE
jgi:hypothetical protein